MNQTAEQFGALNKKQMETAFQAFQIGFGAWGMLIKLNLEATRSLLQEGVATAPKLTSVNDPAAVAEWTSSQARAALDKVSGYSRNVYQIVGDASGKWGNLLEQTLLSTNQEIEQWVEEVLKGSSIPQPEATAVATKAAMANAKSVIEGISKAVRQTAGYADANVRAAAEATAQVVKGSAI